MAEAHDKLCEEADVGSLCDCSCAGAKHAIRHTKGGVPGAGAVSKAAQKTAHEAGKAAVINNRAVPKEGSKVSASAPKSFRDAPPPAGKEPPRISMMSNLAGHSDDELTAAHAAIEAKIGPQGGISGPQRDIQQKIERELAVRGRPLPGSRPDTRGKPVFRKSDPKTAKEIEGSGKGNELDQRAAARTKAKFGDAAEVTRANTSEGDRVTHVREGKGTVQNAPKVGAWRVNFDSGKTVPVLPHEMVKGEHTVSPNADTGKPITREEAAKIMFGTAGAKAKIDAAAAKKGNASAGNKGNALDQRAAERAKAKFGDAAEVTRANTSEGDRVTHVRDGVGTVEQASKAGAWRVNFDQGGSKPVLPHEMVKGEHTVSPNADTGKPITRDEAAKIMFGGKPAEKQMTVTSRRRNGDTTTESVAKPSGPAPARPDEYVPPHVKEAIDHLEGRKGGVSSYVYGALNHNSLSKLTPAQRTKMAGQLENIQSGMSPHAPDKSRVDKALASLRAIDAPTGRPKKAKALPERQAKALDTIAKAGSSDRNANSLIDIQKYAGENHVVASALAKKGLLRQGGTNARLVQLTEAGHEQIALARGDQKHLTLTQHVAALAAQADQLEKRSHDLSVSQNERFTAGQQMGNVTARMRELQDQRRRYLNGDSSQGVETRR